MIATFLIEITLAAHTLFRYKLSTVTKITVALLVCLATFQLAEYNICEGRWGLSSLSWAQFGYIAITFLPPLGIHLAAKMSNDTRRWIYAIPYGLGLAFATWFVVSTSSLGSGVCYGNYVIIEQQPTLAFIYMLYYYGLLLGNIVYSVNRAKVAPKHIKKALWALVLGYAAFMVPSTLVNVIDHNTTSGLPSIMCGFAVIFAIALWANVLPSYSRRPLQFSWLKQGTKKEPGV